MSRLVHRQAWRIVDDAMPPGSLWPDAGTLGAGAAGRPGGTPVRSAIVASVVMIVSRACSIPGDLDTDVPIGGTSPGAARADRSKAFTKFNGQVWRYRYAKWAMMVVRVA